VSCKREKVPTADKRKCFSKLCETNNVVWKRNENEMAILRQTERSMVRAMCGVKLVDRKNTKELMGMLGLQDTVDKLAKSNGVRWYGHVLRKDEDDVLRRTLDFKVNGRRGRGIPRRT